MIERAVCVVVARSRGEVLCNTLAKDGRPRPTKKSPSAIGWCGLMFNELQAALARRRLSTDAAEEVESPGLRRTSSSGQLDAIEAAEARRQRWSTNAELRTAEVAGVARREKLARSSTANEVQDQITRQRSSLRSVIGVRDEFAALTSGRSPSPPPPVLASNRTASTTHMLADAPAASAAPASAASPAAEAFARFLSATEVSDVQLHYTACVGCLSLSQPASISKLSPLLGPLVTHRSRQLLAGLAARAARPEYAPQKSVRPRAALSVVIVGAGPVGLRTAIELALLGSRVEVLESRERFSRLQVLHLWEWVECDLIDLGIKTIDPSIFAAADLRRCSTSQMQHSLFKVALLVGVRVRFGCRVDSMASLHSLHSRRIDALVDASGARCGLLDELGFSQTVALRSARALCIVISLVNHKTSKELELRESTWSQQYYLAEFGALMNHGVVLENLVYYRSTGAFADAATHYFVMTTTSDALHAYGALREIELDDMRGLTATANVDASRLEQYARHAIGAFVPELARQELVPGQLTLFDFSERKQSNRAATVVNGSSLGDGRRQDSVCLVTRVGDALQEPFWPEGLGINRGFLGALDCADLCQRAMPLLLKPLGQPMASLEDFSELLRRREEIYGLTKRLSGANRLKELKPHLDAQRKFCYTLEPRTRYGGWTKSDALPLGSARQSGSRPRMVFHAPTTPRG